MIPVKLEKYNNQIGFIVEFLKIKLEHNVIITADMIARASRN